MIRETKNNRKLNNAENNSVLITGFCPYIFTKPITFCPYIFTK